MIKAVKPQQIQTGFSLVEMAIVLAIVALLLGGLLPTISSQMEQQRRTETRKYMEEVNNALVGYAISNKRLPCPDTDGDGLENNTPPCASQVGTLPYKNLGVMDKDAYNNVLRYAVTNAFADSVTNFSLGSAGTIVICTAAGASCPGTYLSNNAVAAIVSLGANGTNSPSADETENIETANTYFVSRDLAQNTFDDLVVWISPNILFNRMVAAGRLP